MIPGDAGLLNEVTGADWTDTAGGMLCARGPNGGIIDHNPQFNEWFIIFNDERECDEWFETCADAIAAFVEATPE